MNVADSIRFLKNSAVSLTLICVPHMASASCWDVLDSFGRRESYRERFKKMASEFLDEESADYFIKHNMAWIDYLDNPKLAVVLENVELKGELDGAVREGFKRSITFFENHKAELAAKVPKPVDQLQKIEKTLAELNRLYDQVNKNGRVTYSDFYKLVRRVFSPLSDFDIMEFSDPVFLGNRRAYAFMTELPFIGDEKGHLGFKKINHYSALAVYPIEFPSITSQLRVDGNVYNFQKFIGHDLSHAITIHSQIIRDLLKNNGFFSQDINKMSTDSFVEMYLATLESRLKTYRAIRQYIDSIKDRRKRILAEGYWFYFTHEIYIGYSNQEEIDKAIRLMRSTGVLSGFTKFDSLDDFYLARLRSDGDLGQAFKDASWITLNDLKEIRKKFEAVTGHIFNI